MRSITWCICAQLPTQVRLFVTPWNVACLTPLSMGFSRQEYWRGLPFPSPGDPSDPGIKPESPALQLDSLPLSRHGRKNVIIAQMKDLEALRLSVLTRSQLSD